MEIEIVTTKKKLTKSLVNQMFYAGNESVEKGEVLGVLINVRKGIGQALLIKFNDLYYVFPANWTKGESALYRRVGKWSQTMKFDTEEECQKFWDIYEEKCDQAVQIYI